MNKNIYLLIILAVLTFGSCKKDGKAPDEENSATPGAAAKIGGLMQRTYFDAAGKPAYELWVVGTNFDKTFKNYKVLFGQTTADAIAGDSLHYRVNIPASAIAGESKLTIVMNGKSKVFVKPFVVEQIAPVISKTNVEQGMRGSRLTLYGTGFSTVLSETTVTLNGVNVPVETLVSAERSVGLGGATPFDSLFLSVRREFNMGHTLSMTIPNNATSGKITVTSYGKSVTYPYDISVLPATFTTSPSPDLKSISFDAAGNLYGVWRNTVVKVSPGGTATTLATIGGENFVLGDCVADPAGNVYVASGSDYNWQAKYEYTENSSKIYKISAGGTLSVFAGSTNGLVDAQGTAAKFRGPTQMVRNPTTGDLYVADYLLIRKITPSGQVSTFAGSNNPAGTGYSNGFKDGQGTAASFLNIYDMGIDAANGDIYVMDSGSNAYLRKVTATGYVSSITLNRSDPSNGRIPSFLPGNNTMGMVIDATNTMYIASAAAVFKVQNGTITDTFFNPLGESIYGMTLDATGAIRFIANKKLYKIAQ